MRCKNVCIFVCVRVCVCIYESRIYLEICDIKMLLMTLSTYNQGDYSSR